MLLLLCVAALAAGSLADPVSQPVYQEQQYVSAQALPPQYRQYYAASAATPVHEAQPEVEQQYQQLPQQYQTAQPLLRPIDKQIQKAAGNVIGPHYAQQVQDIQLQQQAQQQQINLQRNALRVATAPRAPSLQYQRQQQAAVPKFLAQQPQQEQEEAPEQYDSNPSYQFGFDVKDDLYTNYQNRKEQREGDKITGSYSVVDSDGYIRTVTYTADPKNGFKAEVSRQPTDIVVKIPTPQPPVEQQYRQQQYYEVPAGQPQQHEQQGQKQRIVYQYQ